MSLDTIEMPLLGGVIIGVAVTLMLFLNGRVAGISGIIAGGLRAPTKDTYWRLSFVIGLLAGGFVLKSFDQEVFLNSTHRSLVEIALAGLLVGYGTVMGSGCTSGHGICGVSRFSLRSLVATFTFILFGFLTVTFLNSVTGVGQ